MENILKLVIHRTKSLKRKGKILYNTSTTKQDNYRRSASFCISGSADDMVEFTAKSIQSFRRTQRVKRYEAKATAQSVFSPDQDVEKVRLGLSEVCITVTLLV